jgi:predicted RNA binding protein YcfA (HicA-like mRNA interferase family)
VHDLKAWERVARKQGWQVEIKRSGHAHWTTPSGQVVTVPTSVPTHGNTLRAVRHRLRKAGLAI